MSEKACKSTKCKCTLDTAHTEFNEKTVLLSFCMQRINIGWKHFTCAFVAIYIVWSAYEISSLKFQMKTILHDKCIRGMSDAEINLNMHLKKNMELSPATSTDSESSYTQISDRSKRSTNNTVTRKKKHKNKKRKRRRKCHCKPGKDGAIGPRGPRGIPGATGAAFASFAAHYVAKFQTPKFNSFDSGKSCESKWSGVLCRGNATYVNNAKGNIIQFLDTNDLNDTVMSPFVSAVDGKFKVRQEGLMLFYLNIALWSKGPFKESFAVHVDKERIMQCIETKDYTVHSDISPIFNAKEKTCSATGLHYVRKDQVVSIKILSADTAITLFPELTYFGAILLR